MKINPIVLAIQKQTWAIDPRFVQENLSLLKLMLEGKMDFSVDTPSPVLAINMSEPSQINDVSSDMSMVDFSKVQKNSILKIPIHGSMFKYGGMCSWGATDVEKTLLLAANNKNIAGVILDLDSGGGEVGSVPPILNGIAALKKAKKSIVAHADYACSAAYWVAAACDKIIATNDISSTFGSIGVMIEFFDVLPILKEMGYVHHYITADQSSEKNSDFNKMLEGDYSLIKNNVLNPLADAFIKNVKSLRAIVGNDEHVMFKGKTFFANESLALGLIDGIGNVDACVDFILNRNSNPKTNINMKKFPLIIGLLALQSLELKDDSADLSLEDFNKLCEEAGLKFDDIKADDKFVNLKISALEKIELALKANAENQNADTTESENSETETTEAEQSESENSETETTDTENADNSNSDDANASGNSPIMKVLTKKIEAIQASHKKEIDEIKSSLVKKPIQISSENPENKPKKIIQMKKNINSRERVLDNNFLFGENAGYLKVSNDRPWNVAAANMMVGERAKPFMDTNFDVTQLNTDLGEFIRGRKGDIVNWFAPNDQFNNVFPFIKGVDEGDIFMSLDLSSITQAYQKNWTPAGNVKFQGRRPELFDIKIDLEFENLKSIERTWLSEFNTEGSVAYKMAFIEYLLFSVANKAVEEDQIAMVNGEYSEPTTDEPGNFINKMDGIRKKFYELEANRIAKPFANIGAWVKGSCMDFVADMIAALPDNVKNKPNLGFYASSQFVESYWNERRVSDLQVNDYDPSKSTIPGWDNIRIIAVPHAGNSKRVFITPIGNCRQLIGYKDGEKPTFQIEKDKRTFNVFSDYKKAIHFIVDGIKSATDLAFAERDYSQQMVWFNNADLPEDVALPIPADTTEVNASRHKYLSTSANSAATAITDITGVETGDIVIIECGSLTNASTIANAGNFSLSAAFDPTEKGEKIKLLVRNDGKFIELERSAPSDEADPVAFDGDDTTPDVDGANIFATADDNTGATAITNLDNAVSGETYKIYGNDNATHATTIANSGNFVLSDAWTGTAGNYLVLYAFGSKFYEIERQSA